MNAQQTDIPGGGTAGGGASREDRSAWTMNDSTGTRRLTRRADGKIVAGVAAGLGDYLRIDPTVLRMAFVLLAVFGSGLGLLLYLIAWITMPSQDGSEPLAETILRKGRDTVSRPQE